MLFGGICGWFGWLAVSGLVKGEVWARRGVVLRSDDPTLFWLAVLWNVAIASFGLFFVIRAAIPDLKRLLAS
jgi:hypothetical protein